MKTENQIREKLLVIEKMHQYALNGKLDRVWASIYEGQAEILKWVLSNERGRGQ